MSVVEPITILLERSLHSYTAFSAITSFVQDSSNDGPQFESKLEDLARVLCACADDYLRYADEFWRIIGSRETLQEVLIHHLNCNATPEQLAQIRREIAQGVLQLRQCRAEAARLLLAGQMAGWPADPPELWSCPLNLPADFLSISSQDLKATAERQHEIVIATLNELNRGNYTAEDLRARRARFLNVAKPKIIRTRWKLIAAANSGRATDIVRAVKSGALAFVPIGGQLPGPS